MTIKKEECGCHLAGLYLTGTNMQCPCRALLEKELESVGIRLNKSKPNIYFKVRFLNHVSTTQLINITLIQKNLDDNPVCICFRETEW